MKPLFQLREEVTLQSKNFPELNGYTVVTEVSDLGWWKDSITKNIVKGYSYKLEGKVGTHSTEGWWIESSLKKKYPPSGDSFQEIMYNIKRPKKLPEKSYK